MLRNMLGVFIRPTFAYIDPATTAMVTQIVAGVFISLGVAFGVFRRKIIIFFKNLHVKREKRKIERRAGKTKQSGVTENTVNAGNDEKTEKTVNTENTENTVYTEEHLK